MDIRIPHQIIYEVPESSAISDIIDSLRAAEQLFFEVPGLLEELLPGLEVGGIRVHVESLTQTSPLKELFWITLAASFQPTMEHDVPPIIERLTGIHIPEHYDSIVTLVFCLVLFYGADFIYKQIAKMTDGSRIRAQLDGLVREVADQCKMDEADIRKHLEARYQKKRLSNLLHTTAQFFTPSKRQGNAPFLVGNRRFDSDTVSEFPSDAKLQDYEDEETSKPFENVEIELHAQDIDRTRQGWAGVIRQVSPDRLRMTVYPPITPEDIYTKSRINGDVIVMYRRASDGNMEPYQFHLIRLH